MNEITHNNLPEAIALLRTDISELKKLILEKNNPTLPEADRFLTIDEAASMLLLSRATLYGYVHRAAIPVCKRPGTKRLLFSKQDLMDWVKTGRRKTVSEIEVEADKYISNNKRK